MPIRQYISKSTPIVIHPTGLRLYYFYKKYYLILCTQSGCLNLGSLIGIKCRAHAISYRYCKVPDCRKYAYFGYELKKPLRCKDHYLEGMINMKNKLCEYHGCVIHHAWVS